LEGTLTYSQYIHGTENKKLHLNQGETDIVEIGRGVREGCCMLPILFNLQEEYLMKKAVTDVADFKIGGRVF
jgi:hypothetical protein